MSLIDMWNATQAGCVAVPQTGYFAVLPPDRYRVTYSVNGTRHSLSFWYDTIAEFINPSPPATFRMNFNDKPPGGSNTDPIAYINGFLGVCGSMGYGLGTPRWFGMATLGIVANPYTGQLPEWVHVQRYNDNSDSFGLCSYLSTPP